MLRPFAEEKRTNLRDFLVILGGLALGVVCIYFVHVFKLFWRTL